MITKAIHCSLSLFTEDEKAPFIFFKKVLLNSLSKIERGGTKFGKNCKWKPNLLEMNKIRDERKKRMANDIKKKQQQRERNSIVQKIITSVLYAQ